MSDNTLNTLNSLDTVNDDDFNQYKEALGVDTLPRNASGVPTDLSGSIGSALYRFGVNFFNVLNIGSSNTLKIEDDAGSLVFKISNIIRMKIENLTFALDGSWIKNGTLTNSKFINLIRSVTGSSISGFTVGTTFTDISGLNCTITSTGRPIMVSLNSNDLHSAIYGFKNSGSINTATVTVAIKRNGTIVSANLMLMFNSPNGGNNVTGYLPLSSIKFIDDVAAGTYTYQVQTNTTVSILAGGVTEAKIYAYEL